MVGSLSVESGRFARGTVLLAYYFLCKPDGFSISTLPKYEGIDVAPEQMRALKNQGPSLTWAVYKLPAMMLSK
jgi:hypothetical protein